MEADWLITIGVLALVAAAAWYALQPRCAFVIRVIRGLPLTTSGTVTPAFLERIRELCAEHGIAQALVRGVIRGSHISLGFSGDFPADAQQQLRNWWALSGWAAPKHRR
jgi:hypothetical protein